MDNIAEGFERTGNKEFLNFLYIAKGSSGEVRSQLIRANDVGYLTQEEYDEIENYVFDLDINGYIQDLEDDEEKYVPKF